MSNIDSLRFFIPELFLTLSILAVIVAELLLGKEKKIYVAYLTALALAVTMKLTACQAGAAPGALFGGMIYVDSFAVYFKLLTAFSTLMIVLFSIPSLKGHSEYYTLLLIITLGMFMMAEVNDIIMILIAMEMVGVVSYVLAGFHKEDIKSNEAALKYVVYGAVSTAVMAFGFSYLYGITGQTNLLEIQNVLANHRPDKLFMLIAFVMIFAGLGYKIAMVPFHFWVPDVYEGSPTPVTAFFSVGPKAAGMALLMRFLFSVVSRPGEQAGEFIGNVDINIPLILAVLAVATMTMGNFSALKQKNIKRLLGYSAIAHVGYMIMALVVFNRDSIVALMFYLVVYLFMNYGAFWVIQSLSGKLKSEEIETLKGLGYRAPLSAVALSVFLFSLTGLPPFAGFVGKVYLFGAVIKQGWYILALLGVLNSVVSLFYYTSVVKTMFLEKGEDVSPIGISTYSKVLTWVFMVPVLILGLYWTPVIDFITKSISIFTIN
jgi:NADH-quinone oxidoreductase subunit N